MMVDDDSEDAFNASEALDAEDDDGTQLEWHLLSALN